MPEVIRIVSYTNTRQTLCWNAGKMQTVRLLTEKKNIIAVIASKRTVAGILWQCDAWHWHWHCDWLTHYLSWFASANWRWFTFQFIKAFIAIRSDQQYNWSSEEKWVYWGNASAESYTSILSRSARPKWLHYSLVKECFFAGLQWLLEGFIVGLSFFRN